MLKLTKSIVAKWECLLRFNLSASVLSGVLGLTLGSVFFASDIAFAQTEAEQNAESVEEVDESAVAPQPMPQQGMPSNAQEPRAASPGEQSTESTTVEATSGFTSLLNPYDYESRGRPDPFAKPTGDTPVTQGAIHGVLTPLQRYELGELRLVGILWNVKNPKAMLRDPTGGTHIVMPFAKIGPRNGYIASIREGEIVVVETIDFEGRPVSTAQVVKIAR